VKIFFHLNFIKGVMRMMKKGSRIAIIALLCICGAMGAAVAEEEDAGAASGRGGVKLSGFWSIETGMLNHYWFLGSEILHQDLLRGFFNFGVSKQLTPNLVIHANAEGKLYYNTFDRNYIRTVESFALPMTYYSFYFDRMDAVYSFGGDTATAKIQFTLGYFPFKYNPDARDLGEYLYRSNAYPAVLFNNFDFSATRVAGLKISSNLFDALHQDLLFTMQTDRPPFFDLNVGYIATFNLGRVLELGAGGMYQSLIAANSDLTQPKDPSNSYIKNAIRDNAGNIVTGDTGFYTYAGLKLMGRLSFDPKRLFLPSDEDLGIFGKEDLKLFAEAAILGLQNYPAGQNNIYGYDTLKNKMPIMFGFNVPAFNLLDVLSAQFEWYGCRYPNNYEYRQEVIFFPEPINHAPSIDDHNYAFVDNWKWALYARKNFKSGCFVVGQVARDHIRNETALITALDYEESLRTVKSWFWEIKVGYRF
jgi:hypothetical protein